MKARDVIAEVFGDADAAADASVAQSTLLAQTPEGEGVYIAPDGELMRAFPVNAYHPDRDDPDDYDRNVYRLVPIEEEP